MRKPKIYVIHENDAWVEPLRAAFAEIGAALRGMVPQRGRARLSAAPPEGVFYNRMSASSHTRGHRYAAELTGGVLAWLESHGRRVVNNGRALQLEISKIAQYASARTTTASARRARSRPSAATKSSKAAQRMNGPFITKHNRAGKGLGVRLFAGRRRAREHVASAAFEALGRRHHADPGIHPGARAVHHARRVRRRQVPLRRARRHSLGFELCPADVCQVGDAFCPVGETCSRSGRRGSAIIDGFSHPHRRALPRFLADNGIGIAASSSSPIASGEIYTYDVNTNTNYNATAEAEAGIYGMRTIARYLERERRELEEEVQTIPVTA